MARIPKMRGHSLELPRYGQKQSLKQLGWERYHQEDEIKRIWDLVELPSGNQTWSPYNAITGNETK
jgi:hypothetical protein